MVVAIVVDQLAAWVADTKWKELPATGGFARLRCEGTWAQAMRYAHAVTDTAPGHAALFTGAPPRDSGIYANEVLDEKDARVSILLDKATKTVAAAGTRDAESSSIAALRVPTVADMLREAHPEATIVGVSLKDRGGIFGCGHHPTACLWLGTRPASREPIGATRPAAPEMISSTAFTDHFPTWAVAGGDANALRDWTADTWRPEDEAWLRAHAETADDAPGEGNYEGLGTTFPHDFARVGGAALRVSPKSDEGLLELSLAGLRAERHGDAPTLLVVSLSTNDYVGHVFGPSSWEAWEEMRRLDGALARFFARLDELVGPEWSVVLSGDHGVTPLPELAPAGTAGRISPDELAAHLREAAAHAGFPGAVRGITDPYVILGPEAHALPADRRRALDAALTEALAREPGVGHVYFARDLDRPCGLGDDEAALVCRSYTRGAGDLYVVPKPGWFFDTLYVPGKGTSHGTPSLRDRTVPLLVRAPGRVAAGKVLSTPLGFASYARTLADLLGVEAPPAARDAKSLASPRAR